MDKYLKLKITSDGTPYSTEVATEDGELLLPVTGIHIDLDSKDDMATATLRLAAYRTPFTVTAAWPLEDMESEYKQIIGSIEYFQKQGKELARLIEFVKGRGEQP